MEYALLAITGLIAGVLGGLLGIGGSVIMIPAMTFIFEDFKGEPTSTQQWMAAAMIVNFLLSAPSVMRHRKAKAIYFGVWKWLAPAAMVGIIGGVYISRLGIFTGENQNFIKLAFGLFMAYIAVYNIWKLFAKQSEGITSDQADKMSPFKKIAVGGPMGFSAGLLGIGGGALAVPAQQVILSMPLRNSIATSATTILSTAWLGAIYKNAVLGDDGTITRSLMLAACLAPTAMLGAYLGGHLTHTLPLKAVRIAFIGLMIFAACKMALPAYVMVHENLPWLHISWLCQH